MLLNILIVGVMILEFVFGALYFKLADYIKEKKDKKYTDEIWGRL